MKRMTEGASLLIDIEGAVATLTLNRPHRRNALDSRLVHDLRQFLEAARQSPELRVIILRGAGGHFCAGGDLKGYRDEEPLPDNAREGDWLIADLMRSMRRCPQPIIALVEGTAVGGGFALALAADLIWASETALFRPVFISLGLTGSELGVAWRLQRLVGAAVARDILFTNAAVDADRALCIGLVSRVLPAAEILEQARQTARQLASAAPDALRMTKRTLDSALQIPSLEDALELEERAQIMFLRTPHFAAQLDEFQEASRRKTGKG